MSEEADGAQVRAARLIETRRQLSSIKIVILGIAMKQCGTVRLFRI
jgi:hypothetical protein